MNSQLQKETKVVLDPQENTDYCKTNPYMDGVLRKLGALHDKKNHDYSHGSNFFSNFDEAAVTAGTDVDTVFRVLIGIKLARLNALFTGKKVPNFESIQDTILDLANYGCIYAAWKEKDLNDI